MVTVKSHVAACHGGNWKDGIKSWRTSSMCVGSQFIQCFCFIVFLFLFFNNREKESQPEMRGSTQHNRTVYVDVISLLSHILQRHLAWIALHSNKR